MKTTVDSIRKYPQFSLGNEPEPFVYIGRPSKWGNPFSHINGTRAQFKVGSRYEAVLKYGEWIKTQPELLASLHELKGKTLLCWCHPLECHGDVLAKLINDKEETMPIHK